MQNDKDLFSEDIDNEIIVEYFYDRPEREDFGMLFQRVMKKLNRINQKIDLKSNDADD